MNHHLFGFFTTLLLVTFSPSALAQSLGTLNAQLKQAVDSSNWPQAIQIVDKMILAAPGQAGQLSAYRAQLQQRLMPPQPQAIEPIPSSSIMPSGKMRPSQSAATGQISVVNALVARNEVKKKYVTTSGEFIPAQVNYDLTAEIYNGTNRIARSVEVFYNIVSWNKDHNQSGSFIVLSIPGKQKAVFKRRLQWDKELDPKNKYEGVRVQINRVEWIDEDYKAGVNETRRIFGYWGKL